MDIDHDGLLELLVGAQGSERVFVFDSENRRYFADDSLHRFVGTTGEGPFFLETGDLDGNGWADFVHSLHAAKSASIGG